MEFRGKNSEDSLTKKALIGSFWNIGLRFFSSGFGLVRTIVLARLIAPSDFGLFGIALLALSMLDTFSETGIRQALIQKKEDTTAYLNTAWTLQVVRGLAIAITLFLLAPFIGSFFNSQAAVPILRVIGLAIIFQNLVNVTVFNFEKQLKFNKFFVYQFSGTIVDVSIAIILGLLTKSVWALVWGLVAGHFVRMAASYIIDSYRPKLEWNWQQFRELSQFGRWVFGSSVLVFLLTQGDNVVVGKFLGVAALGYYQMAYRISNLPATELSNVISQVLFPAYSKLQNDINKLRRAYHDVLKIVVFLAVPISLLIILASNEFTRIFLGDKWLLIVVPMQVLSVYGLFRSIGATTGALFMALGRPDIRTKIQVGQLILLISIIYPLTRIYGITGTSVAVVIYAVFFNMLAVLLAFRLVKAEFRQAVSSFLAPVFSGLVAIVAAILSKLIFGFIDVRILFVVPILTFCTMYLTVIFLCDWFFDYGIQRILIGRFRLSRKNL